MSMNKSEKPVFVAKEWDASGAFHFYGTGPRRSFIVEVDTAEPIAPEHLQAALNTALARMPFFTQTFVRKKGLYYYADNPLPVVIAESEKARVIGGAATNYHMIDVTYHGNAIRFAMFHGLCDGLGFNCLIESTLYYYFCLKDGKKYSSEGIITSETPVDPTEELDSFAEKSNVNPRELRQLAGADKRFRLPELKDEKGPMMYRYPVQIKEESLISWCKANGATPGSALSTLAAIAVERENHVKEGVIMSVLPASLRKFMNAEKTFKNCSSAVFMPFKPEDLNTKDPGVLAADLRQFMKAQMTPEFGVLLGSSINMIVHIGKKLPGYFLKNKLMAMPENRPQDTFTVDYVGSLKTNDYSDQISEVRYLNPDVYFGSLNILMSATAGYFHVNFNQTFKTTRYYNTFVALLDELKIENEKLPEDSYLNPEVILPGEQK